MISAFDTDLPVLAVTGLAKEARLATGPGVVAIGAGGSPKRLRALLEAREPAGCRAVVSFGIAGGLDPSLKPGDVVVATGILAEDDRYEADASIRDALLEAIAGFHLRVIAADLAGVETAVLTVSNKSILRLQTGAAAVDMESHVAAAFARRHGISFAAVRVVCDPANRALPAFAGHALKANGEPDVLAVLAALARRPAHLPALIRLARDSGLAFKALRHCRRLIGVGLGVPRS